MADPVRDAPEAMVGLHKVLDVEYVTARPIHLKAITVLKLQLHLFPDFPLVMMESPEGKIAYINENNFDLVLDDSPKVVEDVKVKFPYLFTQPWNINFPWEFRINGWREFYERFL